MLEKKKKKKTRQEDNARDRINRQEQHALFFFSRVAHLSLHRGFDTHPLPHTKVYTTPPWGRCFKLDFLDNHEGANTER